MSAVTQIKYHSKEHPDLVVQLLKRLLITRLLQDKGQVEKINSFLTIIRCRGTPSTFRREQTYLVFSESSKSPPWTLFQTRE